MLQRDAENMHQYYGQYAPELKNCRHADEMWALFEEGELNENSVLTGQFADSEEEADVDSVLEEIKAIMAEEEERKQRLSELEEEEF